MAKELGLAGPVGYVQLTRKFNGELVSDERAKIRRGIAGWEAASLYRRWSARCRDAVWQIDATKLDLWVRISGSETVVRPDLLVVVDGFSRVILSACLRLLRGCKVLALVVCGTVGNEPGFEAAGGDLAGGAPVRHLLEHINPPAGSCFRPGADAGLVRVGA